MSDIYEITCARPGCGNITFSGKQRGAVDAALEAHVEAFHNYMTGHEWYNRFEKEVNRDDWRLEDEKYPESHRKLAAKLRDAFLKAAQKASGIE